MSAYEKRKGPLTPTFHEGPLPAGFTLDFEPALFNLPEFLLLQATQEWLSFYVLDTNRKKAIAALQVHLQGESASSPLRAPFGSVDATPAINPQLIYEFITYVETRLKEHGVREFMIKNPPRAYNPAFLSLLETFLLNVGFDVAVAETGAVMEVAERDFTQGLAHSQSLRRKQAKHAGLTFHILTHKDVDDVYSFIAACHKEKGYNISVSIGQLRSAIDTFPERYLLSSVMEEGTMRAAAVSIRVRKDVLYNFLVNHEKRFNSLSPPILLMDGLYTYCRDENISLLDLGTSALSGRPNFPLLDFKLRLGATPTSKFSFYKKIG